MNISNCKVGMPIDYYRDGGSYYDTFPGKIVKVGAKRVKIEYADFMERLQSWVYPGNIELQPGLEERRFEVDGHELTTWIPKDFFVNPCTCQAQPNIVTQLVMVIGVDNCPVHGVAN